MPILTWLRQSDETPFGQGQMLRREKTLILEGDYYHGKPAQFIVYRIPCPAIETMASWVGRHTRKEYAIRDTDIVKRRPWMRVRSKQGVNIGNVGIAHTHRWLFEDDSGNTSYTIRLARVASLKVRGDLGGHGGYPGIASAQAVVGFDAEINVGVDPEIEVNLLVPGRLVYDMSIEQLIEGEISALVDEGGNPIDGLNYADMAGELEREFPYFALQELPSQASVGWESQTFNLDAGESATFHAQFEVKGDATFIFPFCVTAHDPSGELLDCSDVMLASSANDGNIRLDFLKGF